MTDTNNNNNHGRLSPHLTQLLGRPTNQGDGPERLILPNDHDSDTGHRQGPKQRTVLTLENGTFVVSYPVEYRLLGCPLCKNDFRKYSDVARHMKQEHQTTSEVKCDKCGRQGSLLSVSIHYKYCRGAVANVATEGESEYACPFCNRQFGSKLGLSQHVRLTHKEQYQRSKALGAGPGRRDHVFSAEVDVLIRQYETELAGTRRLNGDISDRLAQAGLMFSSRQIGDRRRILRKRIAAASKHDQVGKVSTEGAEFSKEIRWERSKNRKDLDWSDYLTSFEQSGMTASPQGKHLQQEIDGIIQRIRNGSKIDEVWSKIVRVSKSFLDLCHQKQPKANPKIPQTRRRSDMPDEGNVNHSGKGRSKRQKYANNKRVYKQVQQMYKHKTAKLVDKLLKGSKLSEESKCPLNVDVVQQCYTARLDPDELVKANLNDCPMPPPCKAEGLSNSFGRAEVLSARAKMPRKSASGPDGIRIATLLKVDPSAQIVAGLFSLWLWARKIPDCLKSNRTVLIPKTAEKLDEVGNWRPITIGSIVIRLFTKIVAKRLSSALSLSSRQRGFVKANGCAENVQLINYLIKEAKGNGRDLSLVFLDLAKAFDTIPHDVIRQSLIRFGVPFEIVDLIGDMYEGATTVIEVGRERTASIRIKSGVKQGDPLSPLLFNLCLDGLLRTLEASGNGLLITENGPRVASAAFADDLVLISDKPQAMTELLTITTNYFSKNGLKINAGKCSALTYKRHKKAAILRVDVDFRVNDEAIPRIEYGKPYKYLGTQVNPDGVIRQDLLAQAQEIVKGFSVSTLKGFQKLYLFKTYGAPKLLFAGSVTQYSKCELEAVDRYLRRAFRGQRLEGIEGWLHLPDDICQAFLYCQNRDGGLGIPKFSAIIPRIRLGVLKKMTMSEDPIAFYLSQTRRTQKEIAKLQEWVNDTGGSDWRKHEFKEWCSHPVQGMGVKCFKSAIANHWLGNKRCLFPESMAITALRMRSNVTHLREYINRGRGGSSKACRFCDRNSQRPARETLGHVLGQCESLKHNRIKRHNRVVDLLVQGLKDGYRYLRESTFTVEGKNYRPDILIYDQNRCYIVDVTVRTETGDTALSKAFEEKIKYYRPIMKEVGRVINVPDIQVTGFVLGGRGAWYEGNWPLLTDVSKRPRTLAQAMVRSVIKGSVCMLRKFGTR